MTVGGNVQTGLKFKSVMVERNWGVGRSLYSQREFGKLLQEATEGWK